MTTAIKVNGNLNTGINPNNHCVNTSTSTNPIFINKSNNTYYSSVITGYQKPIEIVTEENIGSCLTNFLEKADKDICAKIVFLLLKKISSDEKSENLDTLLKLNDNDYSKTINQINISL